MRIKALSFHVLILILTAGQLCAAETNAAINVFSHFDSAVLPGDYTVEGNTITFDLQDPSHFHLFVLLEGPQKKLCVQLKFDKKHITWFQDWGLFVSKDEKKYDCIPYTKVDEQTLQCEVDMSGGRLFVATTLPYGRDNFDELLMQTSGCGRWKLIRYRGRSVPIFEIGRDDGKKPIHFFAGEDARETPGIWLADSMIRVLCENRDLAKRLTEKYVIRICPTISLYSLTAEHSSFTDMNGNSYYGGGSWNKQNLQPEMAVIYNLVEETIKQKRLGFFMTFHSSFSYTPPPAVETVRTAGENTLSEERAAWAMKTMETIMEDTHNPALRIRVADKAWIDGVLRAVLLDRFNAATFRIEEPTQTREGYKKTAEKMLTNLARVHDWTPVLEP